MGSRDYHDEHHFNTHFPYEEENETLRHRQYIRRKLDEKFEQQLLKKELEDYEGELDQFDWSDIDK